MQANDNQLTTNAMLVLKPMALGPAEELVTSFSITSDSVVAIVNMGVKTSVRRFSIDWGDGRLTTVETVVAAIGFGGGAVQRLADGTFEIRHAYDVSEDGSAFEKEITLRANDSTNHYIRFDNVTLTPRYKVWHTDIYFRLLEKGDSFAESTSEWRINVKSRYAPLLYGAYEDAGNHHLYRFDMGESILPSPWVKLAGSGASHDLIKDERLQTVFDFTEIDPKYDDFYHLYITLDINIASDLLQVKDYHKMIEAKCYQEAKLIVPLYTTRPPVLER